MAFRKNTADRTHSGRLAGLAALALVAGLALTSCAMTTEAPTSITFDKSSDKAIVILGTTIDRNHVAPEDPWYRVAPFLLTHWQQYSPESMQLTAGGSRIKSFRDEGIAEDAAGRDATVHILEVEPGDYALIGAMIGRTLTLLVEPTGEIRFYYEDGSYQQFAGIETQGPVIPGRNFVFSVDSGQVAYIGHFNFVHAGAGEHKVADVDYWRDKAAAGAALEEYPGITGDMVTLDLTLPTEQAAR